MVLSVASHDIHRELDLFPALRVQPASCIGQTASEIIHCQFLSTPGGGGEGGEGQLQERGGEGGGSATGGRGRVGGQPLEGGGEGGGSATGGRRGMGVNPRGVLASLISKLFPPPPHTDRRQRVIGELIESERRYVANLETLLNFFLPSLELLVAPRDLRLMFPAQLEPLLEAHRRSVGGRRRGQG